MGRTPESHSDSGASCESRANGRDKSSNTKEPCNAGAYSQKVRISAPRDTIPANAAGRAETRADRDALRAPALPSRLFTAIGIVYRAARNNFSEGSDIWSRECLLLSTW